MRWIGFATATLALGDGILHSRPRLPCKWRKSDEPVDAEQSMTIVFALKEQNLQRLEQLGRAVSNPQHAEYGRYLGRDEVAHLTAPLWEHEHALEQWLGEHQVSARKIGGAHFEATISVKVASAMLQAHFYHHVNDETGQRIVRAGDYSVPNEIDAALHEIYGLHGLPLPPRVALGDDRAANVTPAVISQTYGMAGVKPSSSAQNRQAVAEFQNQQMITDDLQAFFKAYLPNEPAEHATVNEFVHDQGVGTEAETEAALDIEYLMGVAPGIATDFWYWKDNDFCTDMVSWTAAINDAETPPLVHSVSYGYQGNLSHLGCNDAHVSGLETNFAKLAVRGITVIFSSGDSGSGYRSQCNDEDKVLDVAITDGIVQQYVPPIIPIADFCCAQADNAEGWTYTKGGGLLGTCIVYSKVTSMGPKTGSISGGPKVTPGFKPTLYPNWPGSSPWVTAVGGTRFVNQEVGQPEMATDQFGSGGGFSTLFPVFEDQKAAVDAYFKVAPQLPPAGSFPVGGRATPDVAVLGEGFQVVVNGKLLSVGGTSASAPAFAAMISLINEKRLAANLPAMGYLNSWLYQNPSMFTDVTIGSNSYGRGTGPIFYGFNCTQGWDPVTGLGTPMFEKMVESALGIQTVLV